MGCFLKSVLIAVGSIVGLIVLVVVSTHTVLANYRVYGNAMAPVLRNGDFTIFNRIPYRFGSPTRGDIVSFTRPSQPGRVVVMRVVGIGGDRVTIRRTVNSIRVVTDGHVVEAKRLFPRSAGEDGTNCVCTFRTYTVPVGQVFVLGDNLTKSDDSRTFGPIPDGDVIGRLWFTYWHSHG